ncbi:hypothetical protein BJ322DRAFT_1016969 [Thelephora terrestris]|uniref:Uncharacterized protein n=1 Tax=Thelephora terrestris TaxID=56493 RepID=A0A9P6LEB6_9AGAM|nr:hypothetical protein BJ322DRAFT_1016969 [Thelephora terrestris]
MDPRSRRQNGQNGNPPALNVAIEALNHAKDVSSVIPARAIFGSVSGLLTAIRDPMANTSNYIELGLACADLCRVLDRVLNGRQTDQFERSLVEAIEQLTTTVAEIQRSVDIKRGKRGVISRPFHAKSDKDAIATWKLSLNRILHVFNTELAVNTYVAVSDIRRTIVEGNEGTDDWKRSVLISRRLGPGLPIQLQIDPHLTFEFRQVGESPPPQPRACFGRDNLIKKIAGLVEGLTPMALIGAGGIGKTSVALAVLHHDRIKERFGDNRRFIRCDQFPASCAHFLSRLSKAIGAGIENPEDLVPFRPFLSSKEMLIVLDNAESILDPRGANGKEIYRLVDELSQFRNISLVITSRITTVPPNCETLDIPTLSTGAARDAFYNIYKRDERSESVSNILKELDFHPLSVALLATVAHQSRWESGRLVKEWEKHQTDVLQTEHETSLATTIELSLASPMFKALGPTARGLLGVVAFYPQGIHEDSLDWLFPTISNRTGIFDKFSILSLTYRSNGFITMLAPLRDHFRPKDPMSSPLLCATKDHYFSRMSVKLNRNLPGFTDARWILPEDVNVEHLLDVFTSIHPDSHSIWHSCVDFLDHLLQHKPRQTVLKAKIERLPDDHHSKPQCLFLLASLCGVIGDHQEETMLLHHAMKLERERGNDTRVALALRGLANANRVLGRYDDAIGQAKEGLEIDRRLGATGGRAESLNILARLFRECGQLDAAKEAIVESIELLPERGKEDIVCSSHHVLGGIHHSKGEREKAIYHLEVALCIASTFDWRPFQFGIHFTLATLFLDEGEFDDATVHIKRAKSHALDNAYNLGRAVLLQARTWYRQHMLKEAAPEARRAEEIFGKLGNSQHLETCKDLLREIERAMEGYSASGKADPNSEISGMTVCPASVDSLFLAHDTSPGTLENIPHDFDHKSGQLSASQMQFLSPCSPRPVPAPLAYFL